MSNATSDKNVANIEDDVEIVKRYLENSAYKESDSDFFKNGGWEMVDLEIPKAMANILAEREQKDKRIQELEQALLKVKDKNTTLFITCRNSIPKQKVIDALNRHKFAYEEFHKMHNNTHYEDDEIRARDFYMTVTEDRIIHVLQKLLEGERK